MKKCISVVVAIALMAVVTAAQDREKELARIQAAGNVLNDIQAAPDKGIPAEIMSSADCVAVIPSMLKGGFVVGGSYGRGIATCRHGDQWSAPAPIRLEGGSWGLQIGGQAVDLVMLIMNKKGMDQLLQSKFKVGADVSAAAGPVGRHVEGTTDWKMRAEVLTYSRARGAFAGITLNGAVIRQDEDVTTALYGRMVPFTQILSGSVPAPQGTQTFLAEVSRYFRSARSSQVAGGQTTTTPAQAGNTAPSAPASPASTAGPANAGSLSGSTPPSSSVGASTSAPATPAQSAGITSPGTPATSAGAAGVVASPTLPPRQSEPSVAGTVSGATTAGSSTSAAGAATEENAPGGTPRQSSVSTAPAATGPSALTPADVKASIEKALRDAAGISTGGVIVNVTENAVELTGSVPTAADKEAVHRIAEQNAGGRKIEDSWLVVK